MGGAEQEGSSRLGERVQGAIGGRDRKYAASWSGDPEKGRGINTEIDKGRWGDSQRLSGER